jgi:hypothetical protein
VTRNPAFCAGAPNANDQPTGNWLPLTALFALCLLPRAVMAFRVPGICPDGVLYIRLGKAFEAGRLDLFLADIRFNIYPLILSALHQAGLGWETAGTTWGVVISSCTILPLYGWIRRAFDDRTALGAGFLYAVHPGLVRWSVEIVRDSTFWFLLAASVYLLWRAMTELRWRWFLAAGTTIALACLTRMEGLALFLLLAAWSLWRVRQGAVSPSPLLPFPPSSCLTVRLLLGGLICVSVYPLALLAINQLWYQGNVTDLVRTQPADLARDWARSTITGERETTNLGRPDLGPPLPAWKLAERYATGLFKGFSAIYLLMLGFGLAAARSYFSGGRSKRQLSALMLALASVAGPILLGIWIHLYWSREAGPRYFFPIVMLVSPLASAGLWRLLDAARAGAGTAAQRWSALAGYWSKHLTLRLHRGMSAPRLRFGLLISAIAVVQMLVAFSGDTRSRAAAVEVGQWVRQRYGPAVRIFGPDGLTQVAAHFAEARSDSYSEYAKTAAVVRRLNRFRPVVVLLAADDRRPREDITAQLEGLGFKPVDNGALPPVGSWIQVMTRSVTKRQITRT